MSRTAVLLAIALTLAACGTSPATAPKGSRQLRPQAVPETPVDAPLAAPDAATDPALRARVDAAVARLDAVRSISGKLAFREFKDAQADHGDAKIAFRRKPFAARVDIVESNRMLAHGGSMLWTGGTTLKIKPLKLPLSIEFSWESPQVVSLRGYRIDQTDIFSMGKVLRKPGAQLRALGIKRTRGEEAFCVEVIGGSDLPGLTREVIGIHTTHNIPTYREMYQGDKLVHQGQGYQLQVDRPVDPDRFEL